MNMLVSKKRSTQLTRQPSSLLLKRVDKLPEIHLDSVEIVNDDEDEK